VQPRPVQSLAGGLGWHRGICLLVGQPFSRVQLLPERLEDPVHMRRPERIFVDSMSDLFHDDVPSEYIWRVWDVMARTPRHLYMILTKRPERMRHVVREIVDRVGVLDNVALGVSAKDQQALDARGPYLLGTPARWRFLSLEPLLGPIALYGLLGAGFLGKQRNWTLHFEEEWGWRAHEWSGGYIGFPNRGGSHVYDPRPGLDLVIVGGESGARARPRDLPGGQEAFRVLDWIGDLVQQCQDGEVCCFVKQLGSVWAKTVGARDAHGGNWDEWPRDYRVRELPVEWPGASTRHANARNNAPQAQSGRISASCFAMCLAGRSTGFTSCATSFIRCLKPPGFHRFGSTTYGTPVRRCCWAAGSIRRSSARCWAIAPSPSPWTCTAMCRPPCSNRLPVRSKRRCAPSSALSGLVSIPGGSERRRTGERSQAVQVLRYGHVDDSDAASPSAPHGRQV
jgi:protein gp37